jgi:DNA-binding MarR family transcriptional regulator
MALLAFMAVMEYYEYSQPFSCVKFIFEKAQMSARSHTSDTLTGVTTPAGAEAWRLIQEFLMHGEMQRRMREACEAIGGPPSIVKALFQLSPGEPVAMRDLAEYWQCDASYITEVVDALEQHGIARREPHPTDRRVKTVVLTDRGVEARTTVEDVMWRTPAAFNALTAAEQRQLRDLARKLVAADVGVGSPHAAAAG